jgi:hypothetical protein
MWKYLLLLAVAANAGARSQGPSPSLRKASRPPQQQRKSERRDTHPTQRGSDSAPMVVRISPAQVEQLIAAQQSQQHEQETSPDWWIISLTGLLAVATAGLWKATRDLVRGSEKTAERQLRAYVTAEACNIRDAYSNTAVGVSVVIHNFGQTPAYRIARSFDTKIVNATESSPPHLPMRPERDQQTEGSIGPGAIVLANAGLEPFTPEQRAGLGAGSMFLFVYGEIRYTDAFGKPRWTRFRYVYGGKYGTGEEGSMAIAEEGNECD